MSQEAEAQENEIVNITVVGNNEGHITLKGNPSDSVNFYMKITNVGENTLDDIGLIPNGLGDHTSVLSKYNITELEPEDSEIVNFTINIPLDSSAGRTINPYIEYEVTIDDEVYDDFPEPWQRLSVVTNQIYNISLSYRDGINSAEFTETLGVSMMISFNLTNFGNGLDSGPIIVSNHTMPVILTLHDSGFGVSPKQVTSIRVSLEYNGDEFYNTTTYYVYFTARSSDETFSNSLKFNFTFVSLKRGCMDSAAYNYEEGAEIDDGSCVYPILGCANDTAENYMPEAEVDDGGCKFAPLAFAGQNATGTPGVPLQFSGAGTDEDGTIAKYEWDFDGDGIFEWSSTENGRELNIYNNEGTYTATLRVTDNDGFISSDNVTVIISEKTIQLDDDGNVVVEDADEDDEGTCVWACCCNIVSWIDCKGQRD